MGYYFLDDALYFPPIENADEQGIVAIGGDLSPERLFLAYQLGIFPWFSKYEPIIWWSPNPRFVLYPNQLKVSKSMKQVIKKKTFRVTTDTYFRKVMLSCQSVYREGQSGTWITDEVVEGYCQLHELGYAHSIEVWLEEELVGGLYGVALGKCFFGESMFSYVSNASKTGFIKLVEALKKLGFHFIDCQLHTQHLESLGAVHIPRSQFKTELMIALKEETQVGKWVDMIEN